MAQQLKQYELAGGLSAAQHYAIVMHRQHKTARRPFLPLLNVAKIFIFAFIFQSIKRYFFYRGKKNPEPIKDIEIIA